jgi:threonylcarbamoyladenosine tRNA methylthiotransferase MtaB
MRYSVITFGCRVNQADSLGFEEELRRRGAVASVPEEAELVVVNTCSVTATADQGARQTIRRIARANPSARIVVTGCYATRRPGEVRSLPNVERVVTNDDKPRLLQLVPTTAERFGEGEGSCGAAMEPGVAGRTAYTLRVQTGCAEECSYCIIPATRGRPRSSPIVGVLSEVERVMAAGFKEIAITGVHLGSYGRDLATPCSLADLLSALERAAGGSRDSDPTVLFRISSLEPMDCTNEIVVLVAEAGCFAPHFHLPLQHASDAVLNRMGRPYTIERYSRLVCDIRRRIPSAAIGTDVIVGFPGETDDEFDELADYLERSPLTHIHVFPYSDRPGTVASGMRGKVSGVVVRERARRLRNISERLSRAFRASQVDTEHWALTLDDGSVAVTGNYLKIGIPAGYSRNQWLRVRVTSDHHGEPLRR